MPHKQSRSRRSRKRSSSSRSRKWHASIKRHWGKKFHDRYERCVLKVKSRSRGKYNPWAVCFSSLKGTTKYHRGPRKSRRGRY